jgi:hypothetical protein
MLSFAPLKINSQLDLLVPYAHTEPKAGVLSEQL